MEFFDPIMQAMLAMKETSKPMLFSAYSTNFLRSNL